MSVSGAAGPHMRGAHGRRDLRLSAERWPAAPDGVRLSAREGPPGENTDTPGFPATKTVLSVFARAFGEWAGGKVQGENLVAWGAKAGCSEQFPGGRVRGAVIDLGGKRARSVVQDGRLQGEWGTKALCSHPGSGAGRLYFALHGLCF